MKIRHIAEVFSSIQGEGIFVGRPQIFIRFAKCNLKCYYCDTANLASKELTLDALIKKIKKLGRGNLVHSVAITGGEPLLHVEYLKKLFAALKRLKYKIYLETNGTLPVHLKEVIRFIDYIAMDMKLPSLMRGKKSFWKEHKRFLETANSYARRKKIKTIFVKIVISSTVRKAELRQAVNIISKTNRKIPLVLQPATPTSKFKDKMKVATLKELLKIAQKRLDHVLVIPQVHKILGVK